MTLSPWLLSTPWVHSYYKIEKRMFPLSQGDRRNDGHAD